MDDTKMAHDTKMAQCAIWLLSTTDALLEVCMSMTDMIDTMDGDTAALVHALHAVRTWRFMFAAVEEKIQSTLVAAMEKEKLWELDINGLGRVIRHSGKSHKAWDHERLAGVVTHVIANDTITEPLVTENGERIDADLLVDGIIKLFRTCSSDGWKLTGLRKLGIDPSGYCEESQGTPTIELPKRDPAKQ